MKIQGPFKIYSEFQDSNHRTLNLVWTLLSVGHIVTVWVSHTGSRPRCLLEGSSHRQCLPVLKEAPAKGPILGGIRR